MMKHKKGVFPIVPIILIVILLFGFGVIKLASITGQGQYIERPVFKYVKCEATSELKYSLPSSIASSGEWLIKPSAASSYNARVTFTSTSFIGFERLEYSVCNSQVNSATNCRIYKQLWKGQDGNSIRKSDLFEINGIKGTEYVWIQYQKYVLFKVYPLSGAVSSIGFVPYGLREYDILSGSSNPINPNDCSISGYQNKDDYIKGEDLSKVDSVSPKTNQNVFQPEEVRWYVSGLLTSASPSFLLTYNNQDAWCRQTGTSGEIYKINEISLGSGVYKIASADWSDKIGTENCCPKSTRGSEVCNNNFQWETIQGSECGAFKSCGSPNWVPYSEQKIIKYSCVDGSCKSQIKDVKCASDYDCKDSNQVCDLNKFECVDANVNLKGQVIKTQADNKADCEADGGKWITEKSEKESLFSYIGLTKPKVIVEEYCDYGSNWLTYILIGLGVVILLFFLKPIRAIIKLVFRI